VPHEHISDYGSNRGFFSIDRHGLPLAAPSSKASPPTLPSWASNGSASGGVWTRQGGKLVGSGAVSDTVRLETSPTSPSRCPATATPSIVRSG
jgi:hypothetical protein